MSADQFLIDRGVFRIRQIYTQDNAGGGSIILRVGAGVGSTVWMYNLSVGPDDYAAVRTLTVSINNGDNGRIVDLFPATAVDNRRLNFPAPGPEAAAFDSVGTSEYIRITGNATLQIFAATLVQNETLTFAFEAIVRGDTPGVTSTASGGTVTLTTSQDNVIV